jgi:TM2 domain-containing membrane protein YozV
MSKTFLAALLLGLLFCLAAGQDEEKTAVLEPAVARYNYSAIPKDPMASALFSATFPGLGQLYNREYLRAGITAAGFWIPFMTVNYLLYYRLVEVNTDTFYIEDTEHAFHKVTAPKDESEWSGLPRGEQALLVASTVTALGFYVWGIIDSYRGAKRYNRKLFDRASRKFDWNIAYHAREDRLGLSARYAF